MNCFMQVLSADWNAGALTSWGVGSSEPRMEIDVPAGGVPPGSGNSGTPCPRMHLANATAPGPGPEPV